MGPRRASLAAVTLPNGLFQIWAETCQWGLMRCVIFDLDGTLADTSGDLIAAANAALAEMGFAPQLARGTDDAIAFGGGRRMLSVAAERMGMSPDASTDMVERGYPILLTAYGTAIDTFTTLYPGAMEAVNRLISQEIAVGICTNKPEGLARTLLTRLEVLESFASIIGADTLPTRKPDPAPYRAAVEQAGGVIDRSLLIGDTVTDRETSKAAGVPSVLVTFGPSGHGVADLNPEALLHHFDELDDIVTKLLP